MNLDPGFSHLGPRGARMVDVGDKEISARGAIARARVRVGRKVADAIHEDAVAKGRVLDVARLAGIQAAKRTAELIPLCHAIPIDLVSVDLEVDGERIEIRAEVRSRSRTGVEMEAMTAASVAALTVYDMCKAIDRGIVLESIHLDEKWGGKSGPYRRQDRVDGAPSA
ncbi:MAG: cyclic pyranopterin monophosphate synthase MoaC [Candidatus Eisenbacteria bacterium]|nr:cyclic pyranopterin monophosphate synthase MoaC [Candidatus Latescibacterota bacterium]MBD3302353.1 cyclic pyranopterin monophosphate synthase MoaC [Candidatus Eisenbacteria bacterium]